VTSDESIQHLVTALNGQKIDVLVNNAGYFGPTLSVGVTAQLKDLTRKEVLDTFAVNAAAPLFVTQGQKCVRVQEPMATELVKQQ